jgi:hypothetical protein
MRSIFILPLILSTVAHSQITIGPPDLPSAGQELIYWTAQATSVDVSATGPSQLWDFSMLEPLQQDTNVTVSVSSTPLLYQFFFNNPILYPDHDADFAMEGQEFSFQALNVEDVYDYYKKSSAGYRNVGFGANINGIPSSIRRLPVDWIHRFPMDFGDVDSSFSTWEMNVPNTFFFRQEQWRHNTVDGWGTLVLPSATFDVLRVRSVLTRHDSIHIEQFGTGFGIDEPESVEYKWMAQGMGRPVLTVITVGGVPTVAQFYHDETTSIGEPISSSFIVHPNPASDRVVMEIPGSANGSLIIRDLKGTIVQQQLNFQPGKQLLNVSALAEGAYIIEFRSEGSILQQRLVVTS